MGMVLSQNLILTLRLTTALGFAVIIGIDLSFNVYAVLLKETFNFTQTQVEIVASMKHFGAGLSFLEMVITGTFGYAVTMVVTWLTFPVVCGLYAMAAANSDFFHNWPAFVYLCQLMLNAISNMATIVVTRACLEILPQGFTATFLGMFGTAVCVGKILLAGLMDVFFSNNLAGFFLLLLVAFTVLLGLCYALLYPVAVQMQQTLENKSQDVRQKDSEGPATRTKAILRSPFFHMTFWTATLFAAAAYSILNNITSIANSVGISDGFKTVAILSVCMMTSRLLYGFVFDRASSQTCGFVLLFTGYFSITVSYLIGMFYLNTTTVHALTALAGWGIGTAVYLPLSMLVEQFGRSCYTFVLAASFVAIAGFVSILQVIIGFLYDARIRDLGLQGTFCYRADCFYSSFALLLSVTALIMAVQVINLIHMVKRPISCNTEL